MPVDKALLLYLRLISSNGRHGRLAFPITVTSLVDRLVEGSGLEVIRTPATLADLTKAAAEDGVVFAGAVGGGYVFPEFLPAYDAVASLCKLLELLAPVKRPLSELVAELPASTLVHRQLAVPLGAEGHRDARCSPSASATTTSTCSTGSRSSTSAAGRRCCPTPTSRSSTSTPRADRGGVRASSRRSSAGSSRRSCRRRKGAREVESQPEL